MDELKLAGGLILLILSGNFLVKGSVSIASKLKVSTLIIGMTIVAFGTSAPELLVSLKAALINNSEIAISNVVGSNIANIAFILGISAIIYPLQISKNTKKIDVPIMIIASFLFYFASQDGNINAIEGITGIILLIIFIIIQIQTSGTVEQVKEEVDSKTYPVLISILMIVLSCFGLTYGADYLIDGASAIALKSGISQRVIGVTIVAFGTSLPELITSIIAAFKKEADIAIGNVVGSNIFNIFGIIGISSTVSPISMDWSIFRSDYIWMCVIATILFIFTTAAKKPVLGRAYGLMFIILYLVYIAMLVFTH
jgi:cation:H+ antiporter